ncbi:MAG: hypothetical protein COV52_09865 [Gammaproteobacteria bacterium CG11_big_fil_rev_8_21_14_0_20_46_22]|nr:MAG: hypothetical protein COW05_09860 [Gammaproteobacteria bacterium CG12_big_fil_rev_8_21_14_0_65_46_12]PIR10180.1 MAG: hypothetical protein COV52_09865 [Gammaproteobacteria bacterium CG11_big_fil_rev_8_21_14_0_20_46_22]
MVIRKFLALSLAAFLVIGLSSCKKHSEPKKVAAAAKPTPVSVVKVQSRKVSVIYHSVGTIKSREEPVIKSRVSARVADMLVSEGERVEKGQLLARLSKEQENLAMRRAEASLYSAKANLDEKHSMMKRYGLLAEKGIVSKLHYEQVVAQYKTAEAQVKEAQVAYDNAKNNLDRTDIRSPISGSVQEIKVTAGDTVQPGTPLIQLVNHEQLVAVLPFSQVKSANLRPGLWAELSSPASPGAPIERQISQIKPEINAKNRAQDVLIQFPNPGNWKVGASVDALVYGDAEQNALLIPVDAVVVQPGGAYYVFTVKDDKAQEVRVKLGYELGSDVVVIDGLQKDDSVIVHGAQYVGNGSPVTVAKHLETQLKHKLVHEVAST